MPSEEEPVDDGFMDVETQHGVEADLQGNRTHRPHGYHAFDSCLLVELHSVEGLP